MHKAKSCPKYVRTASNELKIKQKSREDRIRTCDPYVPNVVRYRAALLPELNRRSRLNGTQKYGASAIWQNDYCLFSMSWKALPRCPARSVGNMLSWESAAAARSPASPCR